VKTWAVIWSAMAFWMAGSLARGLTVATYRSVLVTWLRAHTATPASGASTLPSTISSAATTVRHRCPRRPPGDRVPGGQLRLPYLDAQGGDLRAEPFQFGLLVTSQGTTTVRGVTFAARGVPGHHPVQVIPGEARWGGPGQRPIGCGRSKAST
jgi:hypothetical protein